jgi:hypothetical protein
MADKGIKSTDGMMIIFHDFKGVNEQEIGIGEGLTAFAYPHNWVYRSVHGDSSRLS